MRLSVYVEPNRPDRAAILAAIKSAKAKGLDETAVTLPSCGCVVLCRWEEFRYEARSGPVEILDSFEAVRFVGPVPPLRKGESDG
jgi:hypothetical protein